MSIILATVSLDNELQLLRNSFSNIITRLYLPVWDHLRQTGVVYRIGNQPYHSSHANGKQFLKIHNLKERISRLIQRYNVLMVRGMRTGTQSYLPIRNLLSRLDRYIGLFSDYLHAYRQRYNYT